MPRRNFTLPACPHCGQRMCRRRGAHLPPLLATMFDLIEASGARGIPPEQLADIFFSDKSASDGRRNVYVNVCRTNDYLEPTDVQIKMRGGAYRLAERKVRA